MLGFADTKRDRGDLSDRLENGDGQVVKVLMRH